MKYEKDDKVNEEIKKLLKEDFKNLEEVSVAKEFDKRISYFVSKPKK